MSRDASDDEFSSRRQLSSADVVQRRDDDGSFDDGSDTASRSLQQSRAARAELRKNRRNMSSAQGSGSERDDAISGRDTPSSGLASGSDADSRREGRQGPRSPLRGKKDRMSAIKESGDASSTKENVNNNSNNNNSIGGEGGPSMASVLANILDEPSITTVTPALDTSPITIAAEPAFIIVPKSSLVNVADDLKVLACQFCSKLLDPRSCLTCDHCGRGGGFPHARENEMSEINIIRGDAGLAGILKSSTATPLGFSSSNFLGTGVTEMDYSSNRDDGIYKPPAMQSLDRLLTAEVVDKTVGAGSSGLPANTLQLSRISQRLLREEDSFKEDAAIRNQLKEKFPDLDSGLPSSPLSALTSLSVGSVLRTIEDPVDNIPCQPLVPAAQRAYGGVLGDWNPEDETLGARRIDPDLGSFVTFSDDIDDSNRSRICAKLHLHRLNIIDHHLLSEEERRCTSIRRLYMQYKALLEQQNIDHYTNRILNTYAILKKMLENRANNVVDEYKTQEDEDKQLEVLYTDLLESITIIAGVRTSLENLTTDILELWVLVRNIRESQKFSSCKLTVDAKRLFGENSSSSNVVLAAWKIFTSELDLIERDLHASFDILYKKKGEDSVEAEEKRDEKSERRLKKAAKSKSKSDDKESGTSQSPDERRMIMLDRVISDMKSLEKFSLPLPSLIIRVSETENVVNFVHGNYNEMKRRKLIQKQKFKIVVKVDDEVVTSSLAQPILFPSWHCEFNQHFDLFLLSKPKTIALDIVLIQESDGFSCLRGEEDTIGTVFVPMSTGKLNDYKNFGSPNIGIVTHSLTPIAGWFSFASMKSFPDPLSREYENRPYFSLEEPVLPGCAVQGAVLCSVDFDSSHKPNSNAQEGVHPTLVARIQGPANSSSDGLLNNGINNDLNIGTISLEQDFQSMLPDVLLLDPNDPRNDTLIYSKIQSNKTAAYGNMFQLRGFTVAHYYSENGDDYSNFLRYTLGPRLRLLKMRNSKLSSMFSEPIPLLDSSIDTNEVYKQILTNEYEASQKMIREIDARIADQQGASASIVTSPKHQISQDDDQVAYNRDNELKQRKQTFLDKVRGSNIVMEHNSKRRPANTAVVVHENKSYQDFDLFQLFVDLFPDVKRSLKPTPNARSAQSVNVPSCDVLVQVIGAKNIPLRIDQSGSSESMNSRRSITKTSRKGSMQDDATSRIDRGGSNSLEVRSTLDADMLDINKLKDRSRARTFVRVSFQENVKSTSCIEGSSPLWKQSLGLPFCPPNDDFSPANINSVNDEIDFVLFDEISTVITGAKGLSGPDGLDDVSTRVEKRYLGHFSVPLVTIFRENRVEGVFRLETPMFNVGYDMKPNEVTSKKSSTNKKSEPNANISSNSGDDDQLMSCVALCCPSLYDYAKRVDSLLTFAPTMKGPAAEVNGRDLIHPDTQVEFAYYVPGPNITFIKLMMTLDPLLVKPAKVDLQLATTNTIPVDRGMISYTKNWILELRNHSPQTKTRHFQPFVTNSDGMAVFLSRYLTPMRPPRGFDSKRATLHFVSSIPFLSDGQSFAETGGTGAIEDCWCTVQQTLALGSGDEEEHGCMLYNFWYYLIHYSKYSNSGGSPDGDEHNNRKSAKNSGSRKTSNYPSDEFIANESLFLVLGDAIPEGDSIYILYRDSRRKKVSKDRDSSNSAGSATSPALGSNSGSSEQSGGITSILSSFLPTLNYAAYDDAGYNADNFLLVNPCTGYMYSAADHNCPLKSIHTIATPYNVWANIQHSTIPSQINFNVRNSVLWRPFFGQSFPYPSYGLSTIQIDPARITNDIFSVPFSSPNESEANSIENAIKTKLSSTIRNWRSKRQRATTTFHSDASNLISVVLSQLEEWKLNGTVEKNVGDSSPRIGDGGLMDMESAMSILQEGLSMSMSTILKTRVLRGFPINIVFTDMAAVERKIKSLCVHEIKNPEVQFVLAVRVFPLPSGIFSVWIFFGTLEPKLSF